MSSSDSSSDPCLHHFQQYLDDPDAHELTFLKFLHSHRAFIPPSILNMQDHFNRTPLIYSVIFSHPLITSLLLKRSSILVNHQDFIGKSALLYACFYNRLPLVQLLLHHNSNPNLQDADGDSPLHFSSFSNNIPLLSLLLPYHLDFSLLNSFNQSPLDISLQLGFHDFSLLLLSHLPHIHTKKK